MTDTANLEDGFYWVRVGERSGVGLFIAKLGYWFFVDEFMAYGVINEPAEIDPRPIKREDVK